jgi:MFS family permease
MVASQLGARLIARSGPKTALLTGISVLGVAYLVGLVALDEVWQLAVFSALAGTGVGLAYAAMPTLIIDAVPSSETAAANGLNALMRSVGTASSAAVVGMVLAHMTTGLGAAAVPSLTGFRVSLVIACGACAAALLIGVFIPGTGGRQDRNRSK